MHEKSKYLDKSWNYKYVDKIDVSDIKNMCLRLTATDWEKDTVRMAKGPHSQSKSIRHYIPHKPNPPIWYRRYMGEDELAGKILDIALNLENKVGGSFFQSTLVKLEAGREIGGHKDSGELLTFSKRVHVSIISAGVNVYGGEEKHYEDGDCYEVNNLKGHKAINHSEIDRILLILDFLPKVHEKFIINNVPWMFEDGQEDRFL